VTSVLQEVFNPPWRALNRQRCNMNRDPLLALGVAGFGVLETDPFQLFVPDMPPAFEHHVIRAVRR
jgi:hypothetical protein